MFMIVYLILYLYIICKPNICHESHGLSQTSKYVDYEPAPNMNTSKWGWYGQCHKVALAEMGCNASGIKESVAQQLSFPSWLRDHDCICQTSSTT